MLKMILLLPLADDVAETIVREIYLRFSELKGATLGLMQLSYGKTATPMANSYPFNHAIVMTFADNEYLENFKQSGLFKSVTERIEEYCTPNTKPLEFIFPIQL